MKMNLSARDRRAVIVGGVALGVIVVVKFALIPWLDHWGDIRNRSDQARATLTEYGDKSNRLTSLHERLTQTYGQAVGQPLDDVQAAKISFHKVVQDVVQTSGLRLESMQPQVVRSIRKQVPGVALLPVRVVAKCQMQQLAKLLAELRKATCLIVVERLDVNSDPQKPTELSVTMVLATVAEEGERK